MKELRHAGGTVVLEDDVADALEDLGIALSETGMSAKVSIHAPDGPAAIEIEIGRDYKRNNNHVLHAQTASHEGSHLGLEEL